MWIMASRLRVAGFRVVHWNYFSWFDSIENHAQRFRSFLDSLDCRASLYIVAHSMGSIIACGLSGARFQNLSRIFAPPNGGLPVARIASMFVGSIVKPSRDSSDLRTSYEYLKGSSEIETGIIAAKFYFLVPLQKTHLQVVRSIRRYLRLTIRCCYQGLCRKWLRAFFERAFSTSAKRKNLKKAG